MAVDSYLELFTTLFGWQWYGVIWEALSDTGIVCIPFVAMVLTTWKDAARGGSYGNVHELALRRLELEFYVAVLAHVWGQPTCAQWWSDSTRGLRAKILALPQASAFSNTLASAATRFATFLGSWGTSAAITAEKLTDTAVRKSLSNSRVEAMTSFQPDDLGVYSSREGVLSSVYGAAKDVAAGAGAVLTNATLGTMLNALKPMLPIIQAITLMVAYAPLPVVVVLSGYSLSMLAIGAIGIFTINFWTVLWQFAQWIDENLSVAMHPGSMDSLMNWAASLGGVVGATNKAILLDKMLAMLMVGIPVLWTMLMGWAGIHIGRARQANLDATSSSTQKAGNAGVGALASGATKGRALIGKKK